MSENSSNKIHVYPALPIEEGKASVLHIREGRAPDIPDPVKLDITGDIFAPGEYLSHRTLDPLQCHVEYSVDRGEIVFIINDKDKFSDKITGRIERSEELRYFDVNGQTTYEDKELAKHLKKKSYLLNKSDYTKVYAALMKFEANVNAQINKEKDNTTGNMRNVYELTVDKNVPTVLAASMPIFKGGEPVDFNIEICADATTGGVRFRLESEELYLIENEQKQSMIEKALEDFRQFNCPIINV